MLGMLEPYDVKAMGPATLWSVHFISEAGRLAYADRGVYMADPDFYTPPAGLLDRDYLAERSRSIRTDASLGRARRPACRPISPQPKKVAVGDEHGARVSVDVALLASSTPKATRSR